jgi:small-conductance mechanosensitive channel
MIIEEILSKVSMKAPTLLLAIAIFILFWVSARIFKAIVQRIMNEKNLHANISRVLASIIKNIMLILGLITTLGTLGINISAIVAGLGLTGFAFGFAFKDMLSNFISGALIFIYEPFKLGDTIEVEGKTGKVIDINLRYVTIEAEDQKVLVPNSISVSKVISVKK